MPKKNKDLHGNAPDKSNVALLIIDVINDLGFDTGPQLLPAALVMAKHIAALKARAVKAGVPVIYANDNFGKWRSDFSAQVRHSMQPHIRGAPLVKLLRPGPNDYFVLKPKHSGFFSTPLDLLLNYLDVKNLILTGIAGNNCVLFTATDAYLRDFDLWIPADCVVSISKQDNLLALKQMRQLLHADIRVSTRIDLRKLNA
mgnify:CR=1 FL=1